MAEQVMASDTSAPVQSVEDRVYEQLFGADEPEQPAPEAAPEPTDEQPEASADVDELDLIDDSEPAQEQAKAPDEWLDITYNGTPEKISRAEATRLAQIGKHTEKNNEKVEAKWGLVEQFAQAAQQKAALQPEVQDAFALAKLYQKAIEGVDRNALAQLARTDPAAYVEQQAQLEQLQYQHQQAYQSAQQAQQKYQQASQYEAAIWAQRQDDLLKSAIPAWRDPAKRAADESAIKASMTDLGYTAQEIEGVKDARAKRLMHLATKYLELQKAKGERLKRAETAPPVVKPGVATSARSTAAERDAKLAQATKQAKTPAEKARYIQARLAARL